MKNNNKKETRIFYFEIEPAPSEIPANLPGQFSLSGLMFLHWAAAGPAAATLKGLVQFQNRKFKTTFHNHCQSKNSHFKSYEFSRLINEY